LGRTTNKTSVGRLFNRNFKTLEAIQQERERLLSKYGEIPDFARELLDLWEERLIRQEKFKQLPTKTVRASKWHKERAEEFWSKYRLKVVKIKQDTPEQKNKLLLDLYEEDAKRFGNIEIKHIIETCEYRLDAFARFYFPHYLKRPNSKFHDFLYEILPKAVHDKRKVRWAIAAPRGSAKSTVINCIFPIWCMAYNKKKFIILISNTVNQAVDFLADIKKELEGNMRLMRDFPHLCGKGAVWRADEIITRNDIKVLALGTGSKIRGRRFGTERPDLLLGDDLEDLEMVRSKAQRDAIREWFNKDVMFVGSEAEKLDIFVIGTIIGHEALLNRLINPAIYPDWNSKVFKAVEKFSDSPLWDEWAEIYTNPLDKDRIQHAREFFEKNKEEMLRGAEVLWPEGDPYYDLMVHKLTDPSGFLTEKQNESLDTTKVKILERDLKWFHSLSRDFAFVKELPRFGAIDPSLGKHTHTGDPSVILTLAWDKDNKVAYVIDIDMQRRSVDRQIKDILRAYERHIWAMFGVETTAFQYVLSELLRSEMKKAGMLIPIKEIDNKSNKQLRIESLFPFMRDGTILFDRDKFEKKVRYREAMDQILRYTGEKNDADDVLDALEMAFSLVKAKKFKMLFKPAKKRIW